MKLALFISLFFSANAFATDMNQYYNNSYRATPYGQNNNMVVQGYENSDGGYTDTYNRTAPNNNTYDNYGNKNSFGNKSYDAYGANTFGE